MSAALAPLLRRERRRTLCRLRRSPLIPLHSVIRWLLLAIVAGVLIVAHGCHGDEDNELFDRWSPGFGRFERRLADAGTPIPAARPK